MLLEEKFLEFHRYASNHNLPLEAISVGDENKVLCEMHYAANAPRNIYFTYPEFYGNSSWTRNGRGKTKPGRSCGGSV